MEDDIKSGRRERIYHRRSTGNNWIYTGSWDKKMERILKEMIFRIFVYQKIYGGEYQEIYMQRILDLDGIQYDTVSNGLSKEGNITKVL